MCKISCALCLFQTKSAESFLQRSYSFFFLALTKKIILYFLSVAKSLAHLASTSPPPQPLSLSLSLFWKRSRSSCLKMRSISRGCRTDSSLLFSHLSPQMAGVECRRRVKCEGGSTNIAILKWFWVILSPVIAVIVYYDCEIPLFIFPLALQVYSSSGRPIFNPSHFRPYVDMINDYFLTHSLITRCACVLSFSSVSSRLNICLCITGLLYFLKINPGHLFFPTPDCLCSLRGLAPFLLLGSLHLDVPGRGAALHHAGGGVWERALQD